MIGRADLLFSLVIPVYRNESSLVDLLATVDHLDKALEGQLEAIFVVDGSPDKCFETLKAQLPLFSFSSKLILHSRNFGSFLAVSTGLRFGSGKFFAVMAADLQEPPRLILEAFRSLEKDEADVVIGTRDGREDPLLSRISSYFFWALYRRLIQPEMPKGGVDIFACTRAFRDTLLQFEETNSSLIGQIFWIGYRRKFISYARQRRHSGKSAWTLAKKFAYLSDSVFAFSSLPIQLLTVVGAAALTASVIMGLTILASKVVGRISVPGYAGTILSVMFFAGINSLGLGIVGSYTWRTYENTKRRPQGIPVRQLDFGRGYEPPL
jgi:glycosyltransferase involved in cell wall biosynthesis